MYTARLLIVFLLIIAIVFAYNPATSEGLTETWKQVQPAMVAMMDGLYAMVRTFIVGDVHHDRIDDNPAAPGVNFDRIVTMSGALSL